MSDIEKVKERLDIVDVVGSYVSDLKKAGSNYKARCPFHNEKTASFMVNPQLQIYKCFGCGKGGDVLSFYQEIERLDFGDALKLAAEKAGVELTNDYSNQSQNKEKERLLEANILASKFYHHIFMRHKIGKKGRKYARKRGLNKDIVLEFGIGYAPDDYDNLKNFLKKKGFKDKELVDAGLLVVRNGKTIDKFRDRLMQPIHDERGNTIGFSGRYIGSNDKAPKYLNSPETLVFKKNKSLYGLFEAKDAIRESKQVILVEGNIDILSSHRVGVKHIVAPLGTAFTTEQAKRIKQLADEVLFCFDTDDAGFKALVRGLELAESIELPHRVIVLGDFQDADELIMNKPNLWEKVIKKPINTFEYIRDHLKEQYDLGDPEGKTKFYKEITAILKLYTNTVQKNHFIKDIAFLLDIPESEIRDDIESKDRSSKKNLKEISHQLTHKQYLIEEYAAALILQNEFTEFDVSHFQSPRISQLLTTYIKFSSIKKLKESLTEEQRELLNLLILQDLSLVENPEQTLQDVLERLKNIHLDAKIALLTKKLATSTEKEEASLMKRLNTLRKQKK